MLKGIGIQGEVHPGRVQGMDEEVGEMKIQPPSTQAHYLKTVNKFVLQ